MGKKREEFTIYTDLHIGSPTEIRPKFEFTRNTVFLGDNFDLKNTLRKDLERNENLRQETIKRCRKAGGIYISGNHSLEPLKTKYYQVRDGILFLHGDVIRLNYNKANRWRKTYKKGKSKAYWLLIKLYRKYFHGNMILFRKRYVKDAYNLAKANRCHTIMMGHFHPKKTIDLNYKGVRIIFLQKGKNKIKILQNKN